MGREIDITDFTPVTIDALMLSGWFVDLDLNKVVARINEVDDGGEIHRSFEVTFWETIPETTELLDYTDPEVPIPFDPPQYEPVPETWYALPPANVAELVGLSDDILVAVKGRLYP